MLLFLALVALGLSVWLLSDLVGGAFRSEQNQREQWQRAMAALSPSSPQSSGDRTAREDGQRYDLAA